MNNLKAFYLLCKIRDKRCKQLQEHQKKIRSLEQALLFEIQKSFENQIKWVTAEEHELVHHRQVLLHRIRTQHTNSKTKWRQEIIKEAKAAQIDAAHLLGIERALLCLKQQIHLHSQKDGPFIQSIKQTFLANMD
ncbi:hypothetical protein G6F46_004721 [Rhizopus delemar]|uniref:Uncharacterized protein n=2 Tax=Rhizopus TaxID=4842 RepID=A0A9P7CR01_9FUNG|nr:hypothetical protein G6F55_003467 [Rhizopus delemar]KAG1545239.1 hypothetical protein G6F51_005583 [Rhizopus arrhizus]KAG1498878.1 hypothetical protein G6F54_004776 [Rhizopus delemar]KAG1512639.1 hypothetical protein G6F53_005037 [Rhizopus delemar]KAG1527278.1 hypothetical protein G6F52_001674 [Rhizopus delemar]